ncbi:MAG: 3-isopropylmalate dehydrogenase [candidate division Zixibacteria bacterium RBG_16_53_22]|nr:MAG: 3-isopropylmalate dehydrogenase [candidate division Zixibacteria bacterium RBG_16_53_22]
MAKYKIAWMPGDGVGNDVLDAAKIVLDKIKLDAEYIPAEIGWENWRKEGNPLPDRTINILKNTTCALFGAITSKPKEEAEAELASELRGKSIAYASPIVKLRQMFDLRTNLRPCKAYPGNPLNYRDDIDLTVFRENTEDLYSGVEFFPVPDDFRQATEKNNAKMKRFSSTPANEMAISLRIITKRASRNIVTDAFEYAKKHGKPSVTVVEKPNVLRETSGLFVRTAREVAKNYPGIRFYEANIDAMCMWLLKNPQDYSVLVTSNMFGDIISDLAAQLVGGLGFASSGNIGDNYAVFEPTHGSAPKYSGMYKVNPMATLLTVKLMLDWLGETSAAESLEDAIAAVIREGKVRTYDMGGQNTTLEIAQAVVGKM